MGKKDIAEKNLEAWNDVFADIVNVLLFKGKRLMKEKDPKFDSPTLSRIENGKVLPTPETLSQLAEILECETWEIVNPQYLM